MANRHRAHSHKRRDLKDVWDDFTQDVGSVVDDTKAAVNKKAKSEPSTVYETIYTTLEPTFTGEVAGYTTLGSSDGTATATDSSDTVTAAAAAADESGSALPESIVMSSGMGATGASSLAIATVSASSSSSGTAATAVGAVGAAATASTTSSAASATSTADSSSGSSGAAKAGIAIGVLGGLLVLGLLVFFLFNKRRKQMEQQRTDDEKINGAMVGGGMGAATAAAAAAGRRGSAMSTRTTPDAPQLSLRPVTQFMPNFGERRSSKGAAMALALGGAPQSARAVGNSPWERPMTSQSNHQDNPFGNHAERLDPGAERTPVMVSPMDEHHPANPFTAPEHVVGMAHTTDDNAMLSESPIGTAVSPGIGDATVGAAAVGAAVGAGAGAAAGAGLTRKQSIRKDAPQALDLTKAGNAAAALSAVPIPASPAGTEFSMTSVDAGQSPVPSKSAAAIAAAGGPPQSTVHRVQLDFQPTMDDEMELKSGQLVRLLHEYDDGWALCIRLDRSKQGVCPRTCLSARPVKPRPPPGAPGPRNGPPVNPAGPPRGPPRGPAPNFPPGQRPMTPQGRPMTPQGRPMTPQGGRPQSPAMMRPQSPAGMGRPQSPGPRGPYNGGRPQSPGPRAMSPGPGQRSQSPGPRPNGRRMTPPGPSPMNPASGNDSRGSPQGPIGRKPVPGQAY